MNKIKTYIFNLIYWLQDVIIHYYIQLRYELNISDKQVSQLPIIINNFNRLTTLKLLIDWLTKYGYKNIVILDNQSTYQPLLDFYQMTDVKVIRLKENFGHLAFWKSGLYHKYKWKFFVYTDSDVLPIVECPKDFLNTFYQTLVNDLNLKKVGFSIKIDDLPDHFSFKEKVVEYEKKYWEKTYHDLAFDAPIDTTFALYKPFTSLKFGEIYTQKAIRMAPPYSVRHLPWYNNSNQLNEEEAYYSQNSNSSSSISNQIHGNQVY